MREQTAPKPTGIKPPFDSEKALAKVQAAENAWNTRDPERVALTYTEESARRDRPGSMGYLGCRDNLFNLRDPVWNRCVYAPGKVKK